MNNNQISKLSAFFVFALFVYLVRGVLLPIVLSIALYYLLNPLTDFFTQKIPRKFKPRRDVAILGAFAVFVFVIVLAFEYIVPQIINQFSKFVADFPGYLKYAVDSLYNGKRLFSSIKFPQGLDSAVMEGLKNALSIFTSFSQTVVSGALDMLAKFLGLVVIPIIVYFMLKEQGSLFSGIEKLLPSLLKKPVKETFEKIDIVLKSYVESQVIICLIVALITWLILFVFGVPFSLMLAVIVAVTEIIPVIGPLLGGIPTIVMAALVSPVVAINVIVLYSIMQFVVGYIIGPKVMGNKLGIHPLTILLGVLVLGNIIGVWGVFFAAPIIAILKIIYIEISKS